ncbi:MAG: LLM class flavin-dependent oxidoreductase, partial [Bacillota bacterium]
NPIPVWIAVGGTPESAVRAGRLGLPMALGIIGGIPARFRPLVELFRQAAREAGHPVPRLSINSHGFIADTSKDAADTAFPAFKEVMDRLGRERGWGPLTREQFEWSRSLHGADFVGNPEEVIEKILYQHELFHHDRFLLQLTVGTLPHKKVLRAIELLGTKVAPAVRKALGKDREDRGGRGDGGNSGGGRGRDGQKDAAAPSTAVGTPPATGR